MEFKGTKGSWRLGQKNKDYQYIDSLGWTQLARVPVVVSGFPNAEGEANAQLIAAAPELLEACITVIDSLNGAEYAIPCADIVEKAINKALGQ